MRGLKYMTAMIKLRFELRHCMKRCDSKYSCMRNVKILNDLESWRKTVFSNVKKKKKIMRIKKNIGLRTNLFPPADI